MSAARKFRNFFQVAVVFGIGALFFIFFPPAIQFIEGAAMNLRRFWWLVLLVGISLWIKWVLSKRNPR